MKDKKKKPVKFMIICCLIFLFCLTPPAMFVRSLLVMTVYSHLMAKDSLTDTGEFSISIPGGLSTLRADWYPFVMTFQDNAGFQEYMGNPNLELTILYNFPAFSLARGCSRLYDPHSPYYSSFYGAYLVRDTTGDAYGFQSDGSINEREITAVSSFDYYELVLSDFGLSQEDFIFDCNITDVKENVSYAGFDGWTRIDSDMKINGTCHTAREDVTSYLQYGSPAYSISSEFASIPMYGRIYARHFPQWNVSVFFYILVNDEAALLNCDKDILSQSRLSSK